MPSKPISRLSVAQACRAFVIWAQSLNLPPESCPSLTAGAGAPTASEPNGSMYLRNNGTSNTTAYVRAAGAWDAIEAGADFGAAGLLADIIAESTADTGVTIDGALVKDGHILDSVGFYDSAAPTKIVRMDAGGVAAGNTRVLTMPDNDVDLGALPLASMLEMAADGFIGNDAGAAADPQHLTVAEANTLLNVATTTAPGTVEIATTAEVDTGTDDVRAISPLALAGSAPTIDGGNITGIPTGAFDANAVALADMAQMAADGLMGNDAGAAADPQHLTVAEANTLLNVATQTAPGTVEIATTVEVDTGTDDARAISPLALAGSAPAIVATNITGSVAGIDSTAAAYLTAMADQLVTATIAVADASGGATDSALEVTLITAEDGSAVASARQFLIQTGAAQYAPMQTLNGTTTFGTATKGSIAASGNGWALVTTDASGEFDCTATNSADETVYFWCLTAPAGDAVAERCVVVSSNSDDATWAA